MGGERGVCLRGARQGRKDVWKGTMAMRVIAFLGHPDVVGKRQQHHNKGRNGKK